MLKRYHLWVDDGLVRKIPDSEEGTWCEWSDVAPLLDVLRCAKDAVDSVPDQGKAERLMAAIDRAEKAGME